MAESPVEGWAVLRQAGKGDGALEVPSRATGIQSGFGPARYALGPNGEPRLLIPCSEAGQRRNLGATPKLDVSVVRYRHAGRHAPFIDIMCRDRGLDAVFAELAGEILARLAAGTTPHDATAGTIADFRELLTGNDRDEISRETIIGLIGELHVLRLLSALNPEAIHAWTGPHDMRHDFRRRNLAIEVKTSSRSDSSRIGISGWEQLLPPSGGDLVLVHLRLEQAESGDLKLSSLVEDLVSTGVDRTKLLAGIAELGCNDPAHPSWNRLAFSLEGLDGYRVEEGFPRIVPTVFLGGHAPQGIGRLEYEVDLGHAAAFRIADADLRACFSGFMA